MNEGVGIRYRSLLGILLSGLGILAVAGWLVAWFAASRWHSVTYWQGTPSGFSIPLLLTLALALTFVIYGLTTWIFPALSRHRWLLVMLLVAFAELIVIRLFGVALGQKMVSDYGLAQTCVEAARVCHGHSLYFEYWATYELLISLLGVVFAPTLTTAQAFNALLAASAVYPVYKISERIAGGFAAVFVTIVMGLSPVVLVYSTFLSGEYAGAVSLLYAAFLLDRAVQDGCKPGKAGCLAVMAGILLGFSQAMKPLSLIFFGAVAVCGCLGVLASRTRVRRLVTLVALCLLMFLSCRSVVAAIRVLAFGIEGAVPTAQASAIPWRGLCVGLNLSSRGAWTAEISSKAHSMSEEEAKRFVLHRARGEYKSYPGLFLDKFKTLYQEDSWLTFWYDQTVGKSASTIFSHWLDGWFMLVHFCGLMGAVGLVLSLWKGWARLRMGVFSLLIIGAFTVVIMILEIQQRYRMSIYPFYFLVIPYAWVWFGRNPIYSAVSGILSRIGRQCLVGRYSQLIRCAAAGLSGKVVRT